MCHNDLRGNFGICHNDFERKTLAEFAFNFVAFFGKGWSWPKLNSQAEIRSIKWQRKRMKKSEGRTQVSESLGVFHLSNVVGRPEEDRGKERRC